MHCVGHGGWGFDGGLKWDGQRRLTEEMSGQRLEEVEGVGLVDIWEKTMPGGQEERTKAHGKCVPHALWRNHRGAKMRARRR